MKIKYQLHQYDVINIYRIMRNLQSPIGSIGFTLCVLFVSTLKVLSIPRRSLFSMNILYYMYSVLLRLSFKEAFTSSTSRIAKEQQTEGGYSPNLPFRHLFNSGLNPWLSRKTTFYDFSWSPIAPNRVINTKNQTRAQIF